MEHYVYLLIDPRAGRPFYVGKGQGDRMLRHVWCIKSESRKKHSNPIKNKQIREMLAQGVQPEYQCEYFDTKQEAFQREVQLIEFYGRRIDKSGILTNMSLGGDAPPVTNRKIVYQFKETGELVATYPSAEAAARVIGVTSGNIRGVCIPGISQGVRCKGYLFSYMNNCPQLKNTKERRVNQYTLDGTFVRSFISIRAGARNIQADPTNIHSVCIQKTRTCGGFLWSYINELPVIDKTLCYNKRYRKILQYSLTNQLLHVYTSMSEASRCTSIPIHRIFDSCKNIIKKPKRFVFKYGERDTSQAA